MTAYKEGDPTTIRQLYGRRQGHALREGQVELVEKLLPQISVPSEGPVSSTIL
ncbi:MAG: tRNA (guanosine(46)-N7)-methyltransferase TrmB, partial [Parasphingorhabdus sp.]